MITLLTLLGGIMIGVFASYVFVSGRSIIRIRRLTSSAEIDRLLDEAELCPPSLIRCHAQHWQNGLVVEIGHLKLIAGHKEHPPGLQYHDGALPITPEQAIRVRDIAMSKAANELSEHAYLSLMMEETTGNLLPSGASE